MSALLVPSPRASNVAGSSASARFRVNVSHADLESVDLYGVVVVRVSDGMRWTTSRSFEDFVSLDQELRSIAMCHRNCIRRERRFPKLPPRRTLVALWGGRRDLWLQSLPARFQHYLEEVLHHSALPRGAAENSRAFKSFLQAPVAALSEDEHPNRRLVRSNSRPTPGTPMNFQRQHSDEFGLMDSLDLARARREGRQLVFSDNDFMDSLDLLQARQQAQELALHHDLDEAFYPGLDVGVAGAAVRDLSQLLQVQQGDGELCVICHDDLQPHEEVRALACGHAYHLDCISQWLAVRSTCCLCIRPAMPAEDVSSRA